MSERRTHHDPGALARLLDRRTVRLFLGILIVLSVLPFPTLEERLRPMFLGVFGVEVGLRLWLLATGRTRPDRAEWAFLTFDVVAVATFLPLEAWWGREADWLRAFRLVRLLVLVRFTRALAADVYRVLTRREQLQQIGLVTLAVLALSLIGAVVLGQVGVLYDYDGVGGAGDESFWDQVWWSFRQVESPDNLVSTLRAHPLVLATSLGLTITGIFVFSYLIGVGTNVVEQVIQAERRRPIGYRDHTLVVGPVHQSELLVREFVRIHEKNRELWRIAGREVWDWIVHQHPRPRRHALPRIALLDVPPDPPGYLYEPGMRSVVYRHGEGADPEALERANAAEAKRAVLLAPHDAAEPDAVTLARLAAIRAVNERAHVFVEIVDSSNVELARAVGGRGTFPLDTARVLGLFLCHHLLVPGIDELLGELLSASGSEVYTHLFADDWERRTLAAHYPHGEVSFADLAGHAQRRAKVTLLGVFLGDPIRRRGGLLPADELRPWVNPHEPPHEPDAATLNLRPGRLPVAKVQGIFGVSETYLPMRRVARALQTGALRASPKSSGEKVAMELCDAVDLASEPPPRRVLVVGFSRALPPMVTALAHFVPEMDIRVVLGGDAAQATARFAALGVSADEPSRTLTRGGRLRVFHRPGELGREAASCRGEGVEAAVFLADEGSAQADALTALRVLHFAQATGDDCEGLRLLVEVEALHHGARLREQLRRLGRSSCLTLLSTQQVHNYFLVHSAFVPGLTAIYEQLLGSRGQEIVRLPIRSRDDPRELSFDDLRKALAARSAIPLALETPRGLVVNPPGGARLEARQIRAVYAVADLDRLDERFPSQA